MVIDTTELRDAIRRMEQEDEQIQQALRDQLTQNAIPLMDVFKLTIVSPVGNYLSKHAIQLANIRKIETAIKTSTNPMFSIQLKVLLDQALQTFDDIRKTK